MLLDALVALFIVTAGFASAVGAIALAGRMAARQSERVIQMIERRNADAMASTLYGPED